MSRLLPALRRAVHNAEKPLRRLWGVGPGGIPRRGVMECWGSGVGGVRDCRSLGVMECWNSVNLPLHHSIPRSHLSYLSRLSIFPSCRFTNFIAPSAKRTAKSWSAPATGRARSVRTVVRRSLRRSSPSSHRRVRMVAGKRPFAREHPGPAACAARAGHIGIDFDVKSLT